MNKKKLVLIGVIFVFVSVLILNVPFFVEKNNISQEDQYNKEVVQQNIVISLTIDDLYVNEQIKVTKGDTVLSVLQSLDREGRVLALGTKEYSGLGTLVESIDGKTNGAGNKYWQYLVNGAMPQVGADKFELNDGDFVEWHFGVSEF